MTLDEIHAAAKARRARMGMPVLRPIARMPPGTMPAKPPPPPPMPAVPRSARYVGIPGTPQLRLRVIAALDRHDMSWADVMSRSRKAPVVAARMEIYCVLRRAGCSYTQIAQWMGRDHTTILHAIQKGERHGD